MPEIQERRESQRILFKYEGFSVFDGELLEIKVRDTNLNGLGLFSTRQLKPGQQGLLFTKLPDSDEIEQKPISVLWCMPDPESAHPAYPYRIGVKIIGDD